MKQTYQQLSNLMEFILEITSLNSEEGDIEQILVQFIDNVDWDIDTLDEAQNPHKDTTTMDCLPYAIKRLVLLLILKIQITWKTMV